MARVTVNNTKFNPFSFEDMLKPLALYAQEYKAQEDAVSALAKDASVWNGLANEQSDPYAYSLYKGYADDLASQAEALSKEGLSPTSRRAILKLKERYNSEVLPIETAYKRRTLLADEQRKALDQNPTLRYERYASNMSLDDFIFNPMLDYGNSFSGALLTQQVSAAASALAKEFRDDPKKMIDLVGGDYYEYVKRKGFSSEAILEAIMNSENASPILTQIVENVIDSSGIKSWANPEVLAQAYDYAKQGLWSAVGQDESQIVQNWRAAENLSYAHSLARQASRRGPSKSGDGEEEIDDYGAYTANDIVLEQDEKGNWSAVQYGDKGEVSRPHGYPVNYEDIRSRDTRKIIDNHILDSDPRQYEYSTWKDSRTGRKRLQIRLKQKYEKPGASRPDINNNAYDAYLNDLDNLDD